MTNFFTKMALKLGFSEVILPVYEKDIPITVMVSANKVQLVNAFLAVVTEELPARMAEELYVVYTALSQTKGATAETEAERITVLNDLKYKYGSLFESFSNIPEV